MARLATGYPFIDNPPQETRQFIDKIQVHFKELGALELLSNSWNRTKLNELYRTNYIWCIDQIAPFYSNKYSLFDIKKQRLGYLVYTNQRIANINAEFIKLSLFSIVHAPLMYLKFVITGLRSYFYDTFNYFNLYAWLFEIIFVWIIVHAFWYFICSRGKNIVSFLLIFLTGFFISYGLLICLVEVPMERYIYSLKYLPFFIICLYPLLFMKKISEEGQNPK